MWTSAEYVDAKVHPIDHSSILVFVMEVFDMFMMIGKRSGRGKDNDDEFFFLQ